MSRVNGHKSAGIYFGEKSSVTYVRPRVTTLYAAITGSAALHCFKVHAKINKKMGNSTPCKIVTPEIIIFKLCTRNYVGEVTGHANFCFNRYSGTSPQIGEILPPSDFFYCLVLSLPFFS